MTDFDTKVRIFRAADAEWIESARNPEETAPPGRESNAFVSQDGRFEFGLWERETQDRSFVRPYDEVALILEGTVEITCEDGTVLVANAGDTIVTPKGSRAHWRSLGPARKVWAVYHA